MKLWKSLALIVTVVLLAMSTMAFAFLPRMQEGEPLPEWQLVIVGLLASGALWLLRVLVAKGYKPKKEVVAIGLYVIAFALALIFKTFAFPGFPPFSDAPTFVAALLNYIGLLLTLASPIVGTAYLIYNVLLKRVLDQMFPAAAARI